LEQAELGCHESMNEETIFPDLPPLQHGHPAVHLRNGIMEAARLAVHHEPDSEQAFFVADLSHVYLQHERWKRCLPEVEPFYGALLFTGPAQQC